IRRGRTGQAGSAAACRYGSAGEFFRSSWVYLRGQSLKQNLFPPNAFQTGNDESRNLRRQITATAHNADIGEFRMRTRGEIAQDARAKLLRILARGKQPD